MTLTVEDAERFMLAGRANFTIRSIASGTHYTVKINKAKDGEEFFVSVLTGSDAYAYVGMLDERHALKLTRKSRFRSDDKVVKAIAFTLRCVFERKAIPPELEVMHTSTCGQCNRKLTHPTSIKTGLGPECSGRSGSAARREAGLRTCETV